MYYHKEAPGIGGTQNILGDKRGTQKILPLQKGGTKDFIRRLFYVLSFACIETCSKTLLLRYLDQHEKFSRRFAAKNINIFFNFS